MVQIPLRGEAEIPFQVKIYKPGDEYLDSYVFGHAPSTGSKCRRVNVIVNHIANVAGEMKNARNSEYEFMNSKKRNKDCVKKMIFEGRNATSVAAEHALFC